MQILESTLLTGPYDWEERVLPRAEYEARLECVRAAMAQASASVLAIFGHPGDYGALAYLTNFAPKTGPALGLVPREGPLRICMSGTLKMIDNAKRLTWVEDVRPIGGAAKAIAEVAGDSNAIATWGFGAAPQGFYAGIAKAQAPRALVPLDQPLDAVRRRKSPRELDLIRGAARLLATAAGKFAANVRSGAGVRSAGLAAERAAYAAGAQDMRVMASLAAGGVPLPLDAVSDERVLDPANAGIAVQNHGYWATGYVTVARRPVAAQAKAKDALAAALAGARAGARLPADVTANAVGLSLEEAPVNEKGGAALEAGAVYAVTSSIIEGSQSAYTSALIAVNENGRDILWQSDPA